MEREKNLTLEELNELERAKSLPIMVFLVIVMVVGIVGNTLVLVIYKRKFSRTSARSYILSLATADLCACLFGIPYHVLDLTFILTYTHTNACKVLSFVISACSLSSVFILLVVGLDRYFKVYRPLKKQIRDFGDRKACLLAAFIAVIISVPNGVIYGQSSVRTKVGNLTGMECFIADNYKGSDFAVAFLGFNLLLFIIAVLFLVIIYGFICRKIYLHDNISGEITLKKTKRICFPCLVKNQVDEDDTNAMNNTAVANDKNDLDDPGCNETTLEMNENERFSDSKIKNTKYKSKRKETIEANCTMTRHRKGEERNTRKITLMMVTITVVFVISYLPFIIISILDAIEDSLWTDMTVIESLLLDLMLRLYLINNVANPFIYSFWDKKFRTGIKWLLLSCFKKGNGRMGHTFTKTRSAVATSRPSKNADSVSSK